MIMRKSKTAFSLTKLYKMKHVTRLLRHGNMDSLSELGTQIFWRTRWTHVSGTLNRVIALL